MIIRNNPCLNENAISDKKDKLSVNELKVLESLILLYLRDKEASNTAQLIGLNSAGEVVKADISDNYTKWQDASGGIISPKDNKKIAVPGIRGIPTIISRNSLGIDNDGNIIPILAPESLWKPNELIPSLLEVDELITDIKMPNASANNISISNKATVENLNAVSTMTETLKVSSLPEETPEVIANESYLLSFDSTGKLTVKKLETIDPEVANNHLVKYSEENKKLIDSGKTIDELQPLLTPGYNISIENNVISCDVKTMTFKGSVATYADLPTNAVVGDVWTVENEKKNYCWNGTAWFVIGNTSIDMSNYYNKTQTDSQISALIDDSSTATDKTFSASKTLSEVAGAKSYADGLVSNMVTIDGTQTITGDKTFSGIVSTGIFIAPTSASDVAGSIYVS